MTQMMIIIIMIIIIIILIIIIIIVIMVIILIIMIIIIIRFVTATLQWCLGTSCTRAAGLGLKVQALRSV